MSGTSLPFQKGFISLTWHVGRVVRIALAHRNASFAANHIPLYTSQQLKNHIPVLESTDRLEACRTPFVRLIYMRTILDFHIRLLSLSLCGRSILVQFI